MSTHPLIAQPQTSRPGPCGLVGLGKMGLSHLSMIARPSGRRASSRVVRLQPATCSTCSSKYTGLRDVHRLRRDARRGRARRRRHRDADPAARAPWCAAALERGLHVFCEKPLCLDPAESRRARRARRRARPRHPGRLPQPVRRCVRRGQATARRAAPSAGSPTSSPRRTARSSCGPRAPPGAASARRAAAASTTTPRTRSTCSPGTAARPRGVGGTVLGQVFSRETEDEVFSTLYYAERRDRAALGQLVRRVAAQDDDEDHDLGHEGSDLRRPPGVPGLPARHGRRSPRATGRAGTSRYTTELTEPVWFYLRGEEYSAQLDHFVARVGRAGRRRRTRSPSAAITDRVIELLTIDADAACAARTRRRRRRRAGRRRSVIASTRASPSSKAELARAAASLRAR